MEKTIGIELKIEHNSPIELDELTPRFFTRFGSPIKFYDDSWGILWVFRNTCGIIGIIRARSADSAWDIVLDEFLPVIEIDRLHECYDMTAEEFAAKSHAERNESGEWPDLIEGYSHQPNGSGGSGIVEHDLNGELLDELTADMIEHLEIKIVLVSE